MAYITADSILSAEDREVTEVAAPEWGGTARLMAMTGDDRDKFEAHISAGKADGTINVIGIRAKLVGLCLVDESDKRIFSDDALRKLGKKSAKVLGRLFDECVKLNGISKEDEAELLENFDSDPNEVSTID